MRSASVSITSQSASVRCMHQYVHTVVVVDVVDVVVVVVVDVVVAAVVAKLGGFLLRAGLALLCFCNVFALLCFALRCFALLCFA